MDRFFQTTMGQPFKAESAKYANIPLDEPQEPSFYHHQHHPHPHPMEHPSSRPSAHHQHVHTRSQSHSHYYHTMGRLNGQDYYYNIPNGPTAIETNQLRRSPPQMHDPPPLRSPHNHAKLDPLILMQVCNEISDTPIDSCPPIPKSRDYTVAAARNGNLYRFSFPQRRYITSLYTCPEKKITLPKNQIVTVFGPSQSDRSKFTVCCRSCCGQPVQLDIQHQLTKMSFH